MKRTTTAAAAALAIPALATALTGCKNSTDTTTGAMASHSHSRSTHAAAAAADDTNPTCTIGWPDGTGITTHNGHVTGTATITCSSSPNIALVSVTLVYTGPGDSGQEAQTAANTAYTSTEPDYTTRADCKPGSYALHLIYSATVNGIVLSDQQWGDTATVTAAQCQQG